jgi:hypothetical protein
MLRGLLGVLLLAGPVLGQVGTVRPLDLPPLVLTPTIETVDFPTGKPVSRPLQPVGGPEPVTIVESSPQSPKPLPRIELDQTEAIRPLGRYWENFEYLLWWPRAASLPPLLIANRGSETPSLGGPNTQMLLGGRSINSTDVSGGRFTLGISVNETETAGLAVSYMFLGTRTVETAFTDVGNPRPRNLARPVINAFTGEEQSIPVTIPGQQSGRFEASSSLRATGWEVNGFANLHATEHIRMNAIVGYRYFQLNEGLRLEQYSLTGVQQGFPGVLANMSDQFDAHNRFHGGQLGLQADFTRGPIFVEATGKVGLGQSVGVARASGQTVTLTAGLPMPVQYFPNGVLGQTSNTGRAIRSTFAVLPEAAVRIGYRFQDRSRFYVGYNFLYLNEVLRPGDMVDRTIDPSQVPVFSRGNSPGSDRPLLLLNSSDFWVQGLTFGLEYRY